MQFEELLKKEHDSGHQEGYEEGSQKALELISRMIDDGKVDQISRLKTKKSFYQEMLKEYNL